MTAVKIIKVLGTSAESWEDAAMNAVERTGATVENLQWAVVQDQSIDVDAPGAPEFRTKVKVGFEVEEAIE